MIAAGESTLLEHRLLGRGQSVVIVAGTTGLRAGSNVILAMRIGEDITRSRSRGGGEERDGWLD
jgi:hypothetical protein